MGGILRSAQRSAATGFPQIRQVIRTDAGNEEEMGSIKAPPDACDNGILRKHDVDEPISP